MFVICISIVWSRTLCKLYVYFKRGHNSLGLLLACCYQEIGLFSCVHLIFSQYPPVQSRPAPSLFTSGPPAGENLDDFKVPTHSLNSAGDGIGLLLCACVIQDSDLGHRFTTTRVSANLFSGNSTRLTLTSC